MVVLGPVHLILPGSFKTSLSFHALLYPSEPKLHCWVLEDSWSCISQVMRPEALQTPVTLGLEEVSLPGQRSWGW